jgi:hypothetical protein
VASTDGPRPSARPPAPPPAGTAWRCWPGRGRQQGARQARWPRWRQRQEVAPVARSPARRGPPSPAARRGASAGGKPTSIRSISGARLAMRAAGGACHRRASAAGRPRPDDFRDIVARIVEHGGGDVCPGTRRCAPSSCASFRFSGCARAARRQPLQRRRLHVHRMPAACSWLARRAVLRTVFAPGARARRPAARRPSSRWD